MFHKLEALLVIPPFLFPQFIDQYLDRSSTKQYSHNLVGSEFAISFHEVRRMKGSF